MGTEARQMKAALRELQKHHKQVSDDLKPIIDSKEELLQLLDSSADAADKLKAVEKQIGELAPKLKDICETYPRITRAIKQLEERAQRLGDRNDGPAVPESPGSQFAKSRSWLTYVDNGGHQLNPKGCAPSEIKMDFKGMWRKHTTKPKTKSTVVDSSAAGALAEDFDKPGVVEINRVKPIHRDWVNVLEIGDVDSVKVDRELAELMLVAEITTALVATDTTVDVDSVAGLADDATSEYNTFFVQLNGGTLEGPKTISPGGIAENADGSGTLTFTPAMVGVAAAGNCIQADQFIPTPECKVTPKNRDTYEEKNVPIKKLSSWLEASDEILEDAIRLTDLIDRRLMSKYARMEQKAVFYGNGIGAEPLGFFKDPAITNILWSLLPADTTKLDALLHGIVTVALAEYFPNVMFLNWQDIRDIWLLKDDEKRYIFLQAMVGNMPAMLWMVQLVPTNAVNFRDVLIMDSVQAATLFVRRDAAIAIGQINDQFIRHKRSIMVTGRFAFCVEQPLAAVTIRFDAAP